MEEHHEPGAPKALSPWDRLRGAVVDVCTVGSFVLDLVVLLRFVEADASQAAILMIVARLAVAAIRVDRSGN